MKRLSAAERRALETRIAKALGWTGISDKFEQIPNGYRVGLPPYNRKVYQKIPEYVLNHNAWDLVEAWMFANWNEDQMGAYVDQLWTLVKALEGSQAFQRFLVVNAPLWMKAEAFLAVVEPTPPSIPSKGGENEGGCMMRAYMAYDRNAGAAEGAILVLAHTARRAKVLAWKSGDLLNTDEFIDVAVRWLRDDHVMALADQDALAAGMSHVIWNPECCEACEMWGAGLDADGNCCNCGEYPGDRLIAKIRAYEEDDSEQD